MVILLNILIALYNSAYTDITENAVDEYLALVGLFPHHQPNAKFLTAVIVCE